MVEIGRILQELAGSSVASVWFEEAVARGYVGGLQWLHLPLIQTREVHAAPAPLRLVRERAKWPEAPPMTKAAIDAPAYPLSRRVVAEAKPDQPSAYVFYLVDSASARMALAMELCSPQWERRNLQLASRILELIGAQQIRESGLLAAACEGTAEQRVTAGFVHALVGSDEWPKLFRGARGCSTGALMAGLCLFYGWKAARDYRAAGHFLGHCLADPLALLHLGVAASDRSWLSRALSLLRTEKLSAAYEWVGDLFADGIKVPRQREVATLWYGAALGEARAAGEELLRLVMKLDDVRTDNRAS